MPSVPSTSRTQLKPHHLIESTQRPVKEGINAYILWDLREHPVDSAHYVHRLDERLGRDVWAAQATIQPVDFLHIICEYPEPWDVVVTPKQIPTPPSSSGSSPHLVPLPASPVSPSSVSTQIPTVTIRDVLETIYNHLQTPIPSSEFNVLPDKQQQRIQEAFETRRAIIASSPVSQHLAQSEPMKMVDLLSHHFLFAGLHANLDLDNTLILTLRRPR